MKITKLEFDRFWDAVIATSDWYVDEGPCPEEEDSLEDLFDISQTVLAWQGKGEPKPTQFIKAKDLADKRVGINMAAIYKRWKKAEKTIKLVAAFDVPKDQLEQYKRKILELGGTILGA